VIDFSLQRTRWVVGISLALVAAVMLLIASSRRCEIVVYNDSAVLRGGGVVYHDARRWEVGHLPPDGSRQRPGPASLAEGSWRILLGPAGDEGREIWFKPGPGRRLIVRIRWDDTVEYDVRPAWWESP